MVKVQTLEEQRNQSEFKYDKIKLILFSQTDFDGVMDETTNKQHDTTKKEKVEGET